MFATNPFEPIKKQFYSLAVTAIAIILLLVLLPTIFSSLSVKQSKQIEEPAHVLTVSSEGKVKMVPDLAIIQAGVETIKPTAVESQKENTKKMNQVIEAVKNKRVDKKDIQTINYNLQALYDWTEKGRIFKGYQTSQNVLVKIRAIDKIGEILEAANTAGANQIGGIQFTFDDSENFKQQAAGKAIVKAKEKAKILAKIAGIKLGKIISLTEYYSETPFRSNYALEEKFGIGGGGAEAPAIEPGQEEVTAQVTLTFEIK